ncbi:hypothetical protein PGQ11_008495 [Apiospora arundinis]|uniref:Uncharacterized protein n=1 Tax=Apiospora arundinis TaxID=335852 RepID=A0ABR2IFV5_9PEZI
MATIPPYREAMQDSTDALNDGPSPPMSNSPALSSSPMPCLQPPDATFTPVSMDSENLPAPNTDGDFGDNKACCNTSQENLVVGGSPSTATARSGSINALIQSIKPAAQATTVNKHASNEYDLLSPGDPSSLSSSPQLDSATSPASIASVEEKDKRDLPSPDPKVTLTKGKSTGRESHVNASNSDSSSSATHASKPPTTGGPVVERDPSLPVRSSLSIKDFPLSESKNEQSLHHHHNQHHNHQQQQPTQHFPAIVKPKPLIRTASTKSTSLVHPSPSSRSRANSYASNIAQLEATAEKLSMTSSIEDAIRDLHGELKRSDSRRSSILAASVASSSAAPPIPDATSTASISRQVSAATSILETNNAARHGGYSPAAYVMSPNNSLLSNSTTRLRSGSVSRMDASDAEPAPLTRNGPGKTSMRSVRSTSKPPALTGIAELEPTTLTAAAMDAADKLEEYPEEEANLAVPPLEDVDRTPNANDYGSTSVNDYWDQAYAEAQKQPLSKQQGQAPRSTSPSNSVGTFEQAELAFADFDGSHCPPEQQEEDDFLPPLHGIDMSLEVPEDTPGRPRISRPTAPTVRPKSYMDPETGQQMMYYPARVPLMLNLPQKLSKKPKASERNKRRSQVLNAMPEATRQSANWLPEVLPEPLFDPLGSGSNSNLASPSVHPDSNPLSPQLAESNLDLTLGFPTESEAQPRPNPQGNNEEARKSRLSMIGMSVMDPSDKRNTRVSAFEALPPQLRASAFFDLPSQSPALELKGGSASATLDDILNASAKAPVSAFTDHAFAGHLGHEVYGNEKKRKSHMKRASNATLLEVKDGKDTKDVKKRSSFFHLRTPSKLSISQTSTKETKKNAAADDDLDHKSDDEHTKLSGSVDGEREPGAEEDDEDEEEEIDEDMLYNGPPTTLLAELQMRKHQQKLRTRPIAQAYPNGMHSTLLELDTVAETERKNRKGKKINLAWETPDDGADDDDDEDLPLGLVMAKKNGIHDAQAVIAEMNRPLGLMERREQEENEPLSRRQARLQGRNPGPMTQRKTMTSLGGALGMGGGYGPSPSGSRLDLSTPPDDEVEGESLGDRMRRLRAKEEGDNLLPRARPVSMAFSTELFSQLGDTFKEDENAGSQDKGKQKATGPVEEEETLGQRRRRLQAEREAREREMGGGAPLNPNMPPPGIMPKLDKRHSLADVLGNNNSSRRVLSDPRMEAERARQEEAARFRRDQESKLAALRSQMPQNLNGPQMPRSGAYAAGQFNDGTGGTGLQRHSRVPSFVAPQQAPGMGMGMNGGMMGNNYNMAAGYGAPGGYGAPAPGYGMQQMNMMPMTMQQPGQQHDMVDRWRQSIVP